MNVYRVQYYKHQEHAIFVAAATQEDAAAFVLGKFPGSQIMGVLVQLQGIEVAPKVGK